MVFGTWSTILIIIKIRDVQIYFVILLKLKFVLIKNIHSWNDYWIWIISMVAIITNNFAAVSIIINHPV